MKKGSVIMGVSRDKGLTWTNEFVNVYQTSPEKSTLKLGDFIFYKKRKFRIEERNGTIQAISVKDVCNR